MLGPIFAREFLTVPRSEKQYTARVVALGGLLTLGLTAWLATGNVGFETTLGEAARFGRLIFQIFAFVSLILVVFFSALTAAGAVAREKDRRTFVLLLLSDLRNREIVLGKMLGSLLFISILLLLLLPVLSMLVLLGGLLPTQVIQAWLVIAASAFAAGSLGTLVALWRDRTYQSLALAVLGIVLYLCATRLGVALGRRFAPDWDWSSIFVWIDPIAAMLGIAELSPAELNLWPPAYGYVLFMSTCAVILTLIGIMRLRVWNPGREPVLPHDAKDDDDDVDARARAHAAPGTARHVWPNPVLWREIRTRAYGRRPFLVKFLYLLVVGLIAYSALTAFPGIRVPYQASYGLLPVAFLSFLLIAAQAVTSVTTERDIGALDLLLVTDLTPKEFIFGKLFGIAWNSKEFLIPPLAFVVVYGVLGYLATPPRTAPEQAVRMNVESTSAIFAGLLLLLIFVLIFGVFIALREGNSRQAILKALGTVFFLSIGTLICIYLILINGGTFEYQFLSFSLFLIAGIGGLLWVLRGDLPAASLTIASIALPLAVFYTVTNVLVAKPGSVESAPPLLPFAVITFFFGFTICAMLVPLLSEFDVALGRTRTVE